VCVEDGREAGRWAQLGHEADLSGRHAEQQPAALDGDHHE
jgi:hypothetical protein